jgi:iron complex transport system substrate-binding protein
MRPGARFVKPVLVSLALTLTVLPVTPAGTGYRTTGAPKRIVSLAPSTTEILFELGVGDRVVGVTRYCDYPAPASSITKVGGLLDSNYEEIIALNPDLTILLIPHRDLRRELEKLNLRTLTIPHETLDDIHEAIRMVGDACEQEDRAGLLLSRLSSRAEKIRGVVHRRKKPRVLICIERDTTSGQLTNMYFAGRNGYYDEIIEAAGGINAYVDESVAYPQLSAESVIELNPDVIVDLVSALPPGAKAPVEITHQWNQISVVAAVRRHRVHVIVGNHALRPGPRYIQFLEELARLLHPEAF